MLLIHPPAFALPGVPASVFGDAAGFQNPQWLEFGPFRLGRIHSSAWVKVVLTPGDAVVVQPQIYNTQKVQILLTINRSVLLSSFFEFAVLGVVPNRAGWCP